MGGLVAQLHYLPALVGEVQLRVKRAHRLVGDLGEEGNEYSDSGLCYYELGLGFEFVRWKRLMSEASKMLGKRNHFLYLPYYFNY